MNLVESRNKWKQGFSEGKTPAFLNEYRDNRDSEEWRSSGFAEELCEYILHLECINNTLRFELNYARGELDGLKSMAKSSWQLKEDK
jgi:hypothetical protein